MPKEKATIKLARKSQPKTKLSFLLLLPCPQEVSYSKAKKAKSNAKLRTPLLFCTIFPYKVLLLAAAPREKNPSAKMIEKGLWPFFKKCPCKPSI